MSKSSQRSIPPNMLSSSLTKGLYGCLRSGCLKNWLSVKSCHVFENILLSKKSRSFCIEWKLFLGKSTRTLGILESGKLSKSRSGKAFWKVCIFIRRRWMKRKSKWKSYGRCFTESSWWEISNILRGFNLNEKLAGGTKTHFFTELLV